MLLMDPEKNEPHHFFKALFAAELWNHIAHELTNIQKQGLHKDVSKNKYLLCYRL